VAPEHVVKEVTDAMNKPDGAVFDRFREQFEALQQGRPQGKQKRQYLLPYFMSGHPGCTIADMVELACYIQKRHHYTEQVQDFTPTPMSVSTCMYYTGFDPFTMEPIHVPKGHEKKIQRALLHYKDPRNRALVIEGLKSTGREALIGTANQCLITGNGQFRNQPKKNERPLR